MIMGVDVLVLNTAVADLRRPEFEFADKLVGKGGLAKCKTEDMPDYSQRQIEEWIQAGSATAGGPGNSAPLIARTGLKVAVGVNLGQGEYETSDRLHKLDAQGRFFYNQMLANGIDMSGIIEHEQPTGTTFIHEIPGAAPSERGGIAYFPNANNFFDFGFARGLVEKFRPSIVYYMYSGLSDSGDANNGRDLAEFIKWCRGQGCVTIADSHTLTADPKKAIAEGRKIKEYGLLRPLLPELDMFFTSNDEGKLLVNMLHNRIATKDVSYDPKFTSKLVSDLKWLSGQETGRVRLFGVTVSDGAHYTAWKSTTLDEGKVQSKFMPGEVVDLVGAGDAFRAGVVTYVAKNINAFRDRTIRFDETVQMGNLFAALYIKAPLGDRYGNIKPYATMSDILSRGEYRSFEQLRCDLSPER